MTDYAIECQGVVKRYTYSDVLMGLDMAIPRGAVVGLLGTNGAGKTTLLKSLIGMVSIRAGTIRVLGKSPAELDDATKARIGYVPQVSALYPWMTVRNITDYVGSFYPRWNKALVDELISDWGLQFLAKIRTLSVGQAQKLAIILALGHEPDLLILDEPAASLDPIARREFMRRIIALVAERGTTVVFSTHITADIERVSDWVGLMKDGQMLYCGELGELKDSVKKVYLSAPDLPFIIDNPHIVSQQRRGDDLLLTVRNFDAQWLERLQKTHAAKAEVIDMNLEDIFVSLNTRKETA